MPATIVATFTSEDDLQVEVAEICGRFHVVLKDLDAGMTLPSVKIFNDRSAAVAYAATILA